MTHRLSTITKADRIIVLSNGVVAEDGTHEELLKITNGIYAELLQHQEENLQVKQKKTSLTENKVVPSVSDVIQKQQESKSSYQEPLAIVPGPRARDSFLDAERSKILLKRKRKKLADYLDQTVKVSVIEMISWNKPEWFFIIGGALASLLAGAALPLVCILFGNLYGVSRNRFNFTYFI